MSQEVVPIEYRKRGYVYATLTPLEEFWRDRQEYFLSCGYTLRTRYRPGWVPSWEKDPTLTIRYTEDSVSWHVSK